MKSVLVIVAILDFLIYVQYCVAQKNTIAFERAECVQFPNSGFTINKCKVKLIRRDRLFVDLEGRLNRSVTSAFLHYQVFYQFSSNVFRPFLVNIWEDFCAYMKGAKNNIIFDRIYPYFSQYVNFNHTCPYHPGLLLVKMNNISLSLFAPYQFIPSGRYRVELNVHEGFNGTRMLLVKIYASVSDIRIETF